MTACNLAEGSKSYYQEAGIYEAFSAAEDAPRHIQSFLLPEIENKVLLDLGCGSGKYLPAFASVASKYFGLDISMYQLKKAKEKKFRDGFLFQCSAEKIPLKEGSIDVIVAAWALGTMHTFERKAKVLQESERALRNHGRIFLVENDLGGEFEAMRGRYPDVGRTWEYNAWLEDQNFFPIKRIKTYFEFGSKEEAEYIIGSIWGLEAGEKVKTRRIQHNVVIFQKTKFL